MKIAFISYEYPPDTAFGGIATYVQQAAKMLKSRGHYIEVIAGSLSRSYKENPDGFFVHRVKEPDLWNFYKSAGNIFADRHREINFDVIEGPEFAADAREAVRLVPDIPLVVKLHTPSILLYKLNSTSGSSLYKANVVYYIRSILKGIKPEWGYDPAFLKYKSHTFYMNKIERAHAMDADEIASPSKSLGTILVDEWNLRPELISHVPYPYQPSESLLNIPIDTNTNVITFLGRLEIRKGVLDIAKAIPKVVKSFPNIKFRFVGAPDVSPEPNKNMQQYLKELLHDFKNNIEFIGAISAENISEILNSSDICVFPSIWENFPLVCLESMSAGRGIVASNAGGMDDMIEDNKSGLLIHPHNPTDIANSLINLIEHPEKRKKLGRAARERILNEYNTDKIGDLQEASYLRAIERRRILGPRP